MKILLILLIVLSIEGCSIYDSRRGVFVSSSVQNVKVQKEIAGQVNTIKFSYPLTTQKTTQNNTFVIGGSFVPISHNYVFDDVDIKNMEDSVNSSFKSSGSNDTDILVTFNQLGMASSYTGTAACVMGATISATRNSKTISEDVEIKESGFTVAGSKDNAIQEIIKSISRVVESLK